VKQWRYFIWIKILELKIKKLEQLVSLKDSKIQSLITKIQSNWHFPLHKNLQFSKKPVLSQSKVFFLGLQQSLHFLYNLMFLLEFLFVVEDLESPVLFDRVNLLFFFESHCGECFVTATGHLVACLLVVFDLLASYPDLP
jgi:hypothetical protein